MINKLEKKFGKYAIRGLMKYVIILYAMGLVVSLISPSVYYDWLMLDIDKLLKGQVWRIITFIIQPVDTSNIFRIFISLYVSFMFGITLEGMWGSFRFNLYYFSGILFNILAVVGIYVFTTFVLGYGYSYPIDLTYLNLTLFLAFAVTFPDTRMGFGGGNGISMFAIIYMLAVAVDVGQAFTISFQTGILTLAESLVWIAIFCFGPKAKYLAIAYAVLIGVQIIQAFLQGWIVGVIILIAVGASMLNFLIFFLSFRKNGYISKNIFSGTNRYRPMGDRRSGRSGERGAAGNGKVIHIYRPSESRTIHKCAVCGRTEKDDDTLEFRFCSKCNGSFEYCSEHLYTHEHKT